MKQVVNFYDNGNLEEAGFEDEDGKQGEWVFYTESGLLFKKAEYVDDKKHGAFTRYHENGMLAYTTMFTNDLHDGKGAEYYENGQLMEEWIYETGEDFKTVNYWDKDGNQLMKDGTGKKIRECGFSGALIIEFYYENYIFIKEVSNKYI